MPLVPLLLLLLTADTPPLPQQPSQAAPREAPFLGVMTQPKVPGDLASGLVVTYIYPHSAAREMGFQLGDEIRTLNDMVILDQKTFVTELGKENVNAKLRFKVLRGGAEVKIEGRIGSRQKTYKAYQEHLRKEMTGKPLPPLPAALWWNTASKKWEENPRVMEQLRGKVAVVISFDDCPTCTKERYGRISQVKTELTSKLPNLPVAFAGIYFDERPGKSGKFENLKAAGALFGAQPPVFPVAVAFYPDDKIPPEEREKQVVIHNHGVAILDPVGNVEYLQILESPEQEFHAAYQKALQKLSGAGGPADKGGGKPAEKNAGGAGGKSSTP